jgi:hypothetical protein
MLIEATPRDQSALSDLLPEGGDPSHHPVQRSVELAGSILAGPDGLTIRYEGMLLSRGADIPPVMQFILDVAANIPASIIATWIVSRFRGRAEKVTINRRTIDLDDEGQVRRIVEEEVTREPAE